MHMHARLPACLQTETNNKRPVASVQRQPTAKGTNALYMRPANCPPSLPPRPIAPKKPSPGWCKSQDRLCP